MTTEQEERERTTDELLFAAVEAYGQKTTAWIKQEATKQYRSQTRLGLLMAVLAVITMVTVVVGAEMFVAPAEMLAWALSGGLLLFVFTASALLFYHFAHQQKKFI